MSLQRFLVVKINDEKIIDCNIEHVEILQKYGSRDSILWNVTNQPMIKLSFSIDAREVADVTFDDPVEEQKPTSFRRRCFECGMIHDGC